MFEANEDGLYPTRPAAMVNPPGDDPTLGGPRRPFIRRPLGDLASAITPDAPHDASTEPAPKPEATADAASSGGSLPGPMSAPATATPGVNPQRKALDAMTANPSMRNVLTATHSYEEPLAAAGGFSGQMSRMGPRPTWNTLPEEQKHHGGRKALDIIAGIINGALAMNPQAGINVTRMMERRPLHEAQETYDANASQLQGGYEREMGMAKQSTSEDVAEARKSSYEAQESLRQKQLEESQRKTLEYGQKIVNKYQDADGKWKAKLANGDVVDTEPPSPYEQADAVGAKLTNENRAREHEADRLGLTGEDRKYYVANGKLKEPGTTLKMPSAESQIYDDWKKQFHAENRRDPNAQETNNFRRGSPGKPPHAKDRQTFEMHWQQRFQQGEDRLAKAVKDTIAQYSKDTGEANPDKIKGDDRKPMDQQIQQLRDSWNQQKQSLQAEKDAEADQYGVYGQQPDAQPGGGKPQQPASSASKPAAQAQGGEVYKTAKGTFRKGQKVNVGGKEVYVQGQNPKTGKLVVSDQPGQ